MPQLDRPGEVGDGLLGSAQKAKTGAASHERSGNLPDGCGGLFHNLAEPFNGCGEPPMAQARRCEFHPVPGLVTFLRQQTQSFQHVLVTVSNIHTFNVVEQQFTAQIGLAGATAPLLFIACSWAAAFAADSPAPGGADLAPSPKTTEKGPGILVNHVGFAPQAAKCCLISGNTPVNFEIIDTATGRAAFTGRTTLAGPDVGSWQIGDFSALNRVGTYQVRAGNGRSGMFVIAPDAYEDALGKKVAYFSKQRWGPSHCPVPVTGHPRAAGSASSR